MAKKLFLTAWAGIFILTACNPEKFEATTPAYLSIPAIQLETDYTSEGTAHSEITTAWIIVNNDPVGTFELPCTVPVLAEGNADIRIYPGITMNGISATRAIYLPYKTIEKVVNFQPLDTAYLNSDQSIPTTSYKANANVILLEDFDMAGLNLTATDDSDTSIYKTGNPGEVFMYPGENNGKAGVVTLTSDRNFFELATVESYNLPYGGESVYLEMTYKTNVPFLVGIFTATGLQVQTLYVLGSDEWNKIYVNLVTELNAYPSPQGYQIFLGGTKPADIDTGKVYLDNIKVVY